MEIEVLLLILLILSLLGTGYLYLKYSKIKKKSGRNITELDAIEKASEIAKKTIAEATTKAKSIEDEAKKEIAESRKSLQKKEKALNDREQNLLQRNSSLDKKISDIEEEKNQLVKERDSLRDQENSIKDELERVAGLTQKEAEEVLRSEVRQDLEEWRSKRIKEVQDQITEKSKESSQKILIDAMHSISVDYVAEATSTTITIEDESLKSRVIGKNGRNIRAFEKLTGVDIIIDESPNEITISSFDPIRREVGSIALTTLLKTGKINPSTIEESITKVKKDLLRTIKQVGEKIASEAGFTDLEPDLIMILGRFKYRFSEGQNLARHTLEVVQLGEFIAKEADANVKLTKLACLLHDAGKVMPEEGKRYFEISAEIGQKFYPNDKKLYEILTTQENTISNSIEGEILKLANLISSVRPGAKRDSYEDYIKRVRALEDISYSYKGVEKAFAIKAGKEIRVFVEPSQINESKMATIAYDIAKEIEDSQNYTGNVKVKVVREFRAHAEAK